MKIAQSLALLLALGIFVPADAADDFQTFWGKFKVAIKKRDKAALAAMTKLPFYYDSKQLGKEKFVAKLDEILPARLSKCFEKEKPVADNGSYSAFCGEEIYVFSKVNGQYLFTDIGVND